MYIVTIPSQLIHRFCCLSPIITSKEVFTSGSFHFCTWNVLQHSALEVTLEWINMISAIQSRKGEGLCIRHKWVKALLASAPNLFQKGRLGSEAHPKLLDENRMAFCKQIQQSLSGHPPLKHLLEINSTLHLLGINPVGYSNIVVLCKKKNLSLYFFDTMNNL